MPTYEYQCSDCGHTFEEFQSITAEPIRVCPQCSKKKVRRLIGRGAGVIFKGSGFYETDYRSESYKKAAEAEKQPGSSKSAGTESSSEKSEPTKADAGAKSTKESSSNAGAKDSNSSKK